MLQSSRRLPLQRPLLGRGNQSSYSRCPSAPSNTTKPVQANGSRVAPTLPGPPNHAQTFAPAPTPRATQTRPTVGQMSSSAPTAPFPSSSTAGAQTTPTALAAPKPLTSLKASSATTVTTLLKTQALRTRIQITRPLARAAPAVLTAQPPTAVAAFMIPAHPLQGRKLLLVPVSEYRWLWV